MAERRMIATAVGPLAVRMRGEGPPAVLWHSLFVDDGSWERVEAALAAERRLVLITGPGHGGSPDPGRRYTMEDCAAAAANVLDELGITEPVDWVGNAWGGHVGVLFAARWPERCRSLVTIGTPVQALSRAERARTVFLLLAYRVFGPARFIQDGVANVLLSPSTRASDPGAVSMVKQCVAGADRAGLRNAVISISLRRQDLTPVLPRVRVPTFFLTGSEHSGWTPDQARVACQLLPNGDWAPIPAAAYLPPLEVPEETTRLVRNFWAAHVQVPPASS